MVELDQQDVTRVFPAGPTPACYFASATAERARKALARCIERAEGPAVLVGPSGSGKSLMLAVLAEQFQRRFSIATLPGAQLQSPSELHRAVLRALQLPYRGMDESELRFSLQDRLEDPHQDQAGILLLVDEAQFLSSEVMEEIRLLTNVVRAGVSVVRPVLAGSPALEEQLADARLESLQQRIALRTYLGEMSRTETEAYIKAHLAAAGHDASLFNNGAVSRVQEHTAGLPRLVNQLCDHVFLYCQAEGRDTIDAETVEEAWNDLQQLPRAALSILTPDDANEEVIEFGALADDIVDEEPSDRIDAIQHQLESIGHEGGSTNRAGSRRLSREKGSSPEPDDPALRFDAGARQVDFSLPDDEWPEVEVVLRDPGVPPADFLEEEVVSDPFLETPVVQGQFWAVTREGESCQAGQSESFDSSPQVVQRDVEPLRSVPLTVHVQTELFSPDPVFPDERWVESEVETTRAASTTGSDAGATSWEPTVLRVEPEEAEEAPARPATSKPIPPKNRPDKKRFATLFSSLQV